MTQPSIGVDVDDFRLPIKAALHRAADLEFRAVELATVEGEVAPSNLSKSGRRHLSHLADSLGLRMTVLVADTPGLWLTDPRTVDQRVELTNQIIALAADLNVTTVTASVGALTHPETNEPSASAVEALQRIGECADSHGVLYAIRPSYDNGKRVVRVLDALRCPSIGVCLDPAAMVMRGANPLESIDRFVNQITLLHARDGTAGLSERTGHETRLGEGEVDLVGLLALLSAADYHGPYIIRRKDSQTPIPDIQTAREVLTRLLPPG